MTDPCKVLKKWLVSKEKDVSINIINNCPKIIPIVKVKKQIEKHSLYIKTLTFFSIKKSR